MGEIRSKRCEGGRITCEPRVLLADAAEVWEPRALRANARGSVGVGAVGAAGVVGAAVSWPWVPAWGSLEPSRRGGENAQKTRKNGEEMGEIRSKRCEGRDLTKDQLGPQDRKKQRHRSFKLDQAEVVAPPEPEQVIPTPSHL